MDNNNLPPEPPTVDQSDKSSLVTDKNNLVYLQAVKNEKKREREPTSLPPKKKSPSQGKEEDRIWKLIEILEEHQHRLQHLENNFVALVRILKKLTEGQPVPPQDAF